ncbi:MAG: YSC84-related protein [Verrucomicrobiota bacterium JB025]|nr:YSC84-related protein [Verrucomicrobiota bacterium JB025]
MKSTSLALALALAAAIPTGLLLPSCANGPVANVNAANASRSDIESRSRKALAGLYQDNTSARALGARARAVLVFPEIVRGGFVFSGQGGNGAMIRDTGEISGYYQSFAASYGLEAGVQTFGYALFFMDDSSFANIGRTGGWELGTAPNLTVIDTGTAGNISNATLNKGTYAIFFDQKGLMGGISVQGSKITRIHPQNP